MVYFLPMMMVYKYDYTNVMTVMKIGGHILPTCLSRMIYDEAICGAIRMLR